VAAASAWSAAASAGVSAAAGAGTGAAAGAAQASAAGGLSESQVAFATVMFAMLLAWQARRAWRASPAVPARQRVGLVSVRLVPHLVVAAASFAAVQLLVVPWLAVPPPQAVPVLP
jgi:hypothetical protein